MKRIPCHFAKRCMLALLPLLIIAQSACSEKTEAAEPVSQQGYYLDTICQIDIYAMESMTEETALAAADNAFALCSEYESLLSKTREGSDIWNINHAGGQPVTCDARTIAILHQSLAYGELSGGRFDITIGQASDLWDFHSDAPAVPDKAQLAEAIRHVDYTMIQVDGNQVSLADPAGEIDLGGIAKGYIADQMATCLQDQGVTGAVINLGGNVTLVGAKDGAKEPFRVAIRLPFGDGRQTLGVIAMTDGTTVTSGSYERYFTQDGKLYHHILDVDTGYPAASDVASVTILGPAGSSCDCDALATICFLFGTEQGAALIEGMDGFEAIFVDADGQIIDIAGEGRYDFTAN